MSVLTRPRDSDLSGVGWELEPKEKVRDVRRNRKDKGEKILKHIEVIRRGVTL